MKKNIAVIFGGKSTEHDVSIITAHTPIIDSLMVLDLYNIIPIYIDKKGTWYSDQKMLDILFFKDKNYAQNLTNDSKVEILIDDGLFIKQNSIFSKKTKLDIVFPAMHGTFGEDGSLSGLLRMSNVPYVGCDVFSSAVAMDKVLTKQVLQAENIPTTKYVWFTKSDFEKNRREILKSAEKLHYPLFIKPVHLGSSIGVSKANNLLELENSIEVALAYDWKVLVEEGVQNLIEVTLPMMGNNEIIFASIERALNKSDFFDFSEKYINNNGKKGAGDANNQQSEIPAKISSEFKDRVLEYGEKTFKAIGCSGIARVDFLIDEKNRKVYVNEVNPLPGSLYAHNWKKSGITNVELIDRLIKLSFERFKSQSEIIYTFNSTILEKVGTTRQS